MKQIRFLIVCIAALLLFAAAPAAYAETDGAEDLTDRCAFDFGPYTDAKSRVLRVSEEHQPLHAQSSFSLTWEALPDARLCLQWYRIPENVSVLQYGADGTLLRDERLGAYPETITPLLKDARRAVVQIGEAEEDLWLCRVYGEGELPEPFHEWQETPDRLDYLLISTHPDDDVLYLGSVIPIYGAEKGYVGTVVYVTTQSRKRVTEAENGAWAMGLRYRPVFFGMRDVGRDPTDAQKALFPYDELLLKTVRAYRSLRPVVVFAQDRKGEYGHWQHKLTSKAAREAFTLAADPTFDPESAEAYGTWQVQKLFLHLYPDDTIMLDAHTPLSFFGGRDAFEVACDAYKKHKSQQKFHFRVTRDEKKYAFNRFGMAEGVVPVGTDVFDCVEPSLLSDYIPPTPEPTPDPMPAPPPTPDLTPAPTAEPSRVPTVNPTATPTPVPTPSPAPIPEPTPEPGERSSPKADLRPLIWVAAVTVPTAVAVGAAAYVYQKRRIERDRKE